MAYYSLLITCYFRRNLTAIALVGVFVLVACDAEPHKTDSELGLNAPQTHGRRVFEQRCQECHFAYTSRNLRGPTMHELFKKQYMPSGTPANDDRVRDVIMLGRSKMPAFGRVLTPEQVDDLLAYLHTL
ncbi:MAG TPA: cytochrome c [Terriglobales bacterium]